MSIDSLTKRVARLEGGMSPRDRFYSRLSYDEVEAIGSAFDNWPDGLKALSPELQAKVATALELEKSEGTRRT